MFLCLLLRKERSANYASLSSEPIQSRCAVLRYTKLTDSQILVRLLKIVEKEDVPYTDDGLEAIIFTAQGDMRQVKEGRQGNKAFCSNSFELWLSRIHLWGEKAKGWHTAPEELNCLVLQGFILDLLRKRELVEIRHWIYWGKQSLHAFTV